MLRNIKMQSVCASRIEGTETSSLLETQWEKQFPSNGTGSRRLSPCIGRKIKRKYFLRKKKAVLTMCLETQQSLER